MISLPKKEESLWRQSYTPDSFFSLNTDIQVDVVIVGGGVTGLTTAYLLKQSGKKVAVLEKETIGHGTSGHTTGKVTSQHNLHYASLAKEKGETVARLYGEANQIALASIAELVKKESIDCMFETEDNYVYTTDFKRVKSFQEEAEVAAKIGLPALYTETTPLPFAVAAAVKFSGQAKINTQQYVNGLAKLVQGGGSYVFEHSKVLNLHDGDAPYVITAHGKVQADSIVVATNVPTLPLAARGTYCFYEYPNESYIVAGETPYDFSGMYISPDKNQYSILPYTIDGRHYVLIGGEGHLTGLSAGKNRHYKKLAAYAERQFGVTHVEYKWSARDYLAYDNIPLVGKLYPWSSHMYVATAMMKWGLTNSMVAGMILRDMISGIDNMYAPIFASNRLEAVLSFPKAVPKEAKKLV